MSAVTIYANKSVTLEAQTILQFLFGFILKKLQGDVTENPPQNVFA